MRGWLRVFAGVLALSVFFLSVHVFRRPADPPFEGRYCSQWVQDLLSPDYSTRSDAQSAILVLGESAVPQIILLLKKQNSPWQNHLVRLNGTLPFLNYKPSDAVLCRQRGAEMIALLGPKGHAAIPSLIHTLSFEPCASDAERALLRCGPAALPALERALSNRNAEIRGRAAKLLREFNNVPKSAVLAIARLAHDKQTPVRRQAAQTLGELTCNPEPDELRTALLKLAADHASEVRAAAVEALGKRPAVSQCVTTVRHALIDPVVIVRLEAAKALWNMERDSAAVLPVLTRILSTPEGWQAAYALAEIGDSAAPAVPALIEALRRERVPRPFRTPPSCAFALGQIGAVAIPALQPLLAAADARTRLNAILAIGFMGERGKNAVPKLLPLLEDRDAEVRHAAALTLATIGAERDQVLDGLSACLTAEDIYMRSAAAQVLREIAPEHDWVIQPE